jgi:hypothetical protein
MSQFYADLWVTKLTMRAQSICTSFLQCLDAIGFHTVVTAYSSVGHGVCSESLNLVLISQDSTKVRDTALFIIHRYKNERKRINTGKKK